MRVNNVVVRVVTHTHLKQIIGPLSIISTVHRCSPWLLDIKLRYNICAGADPGQDV